MISNIEFLQVLGKSGLVTDDVYEKLDRRVARDPDKYDARSLAEYLVDRELLTPWQARRLLTGKYFFRLGRYTLLDCIGKGGMGVVLKARHEVMHRIVALKVMTPSLLKRKAAVARFQREVKTAAALHHPNIITAYDADNVGNTHFLVMEYIDGKDMNYWLRVNKRLPLSVAAECIMQCAEGLAHAHAQGMVHRDIKPVNVLVAWPVGQERPQFKLLDMGLSRFISETQEDGEITRAGQTIGTPDYIAPEAAKSFKDADIRADIFSLGCAFFKLVTGRLPYDGETTMAKLLARAEHDAPLASSLRKDIPEALDKIIAKMLARDLLQRYQTPAEVVQALVPFAASTLGDWESLKVLKRDPTNTEASMLGLDDENSKDDLDNFFRDIGLESGGSGQSRDDIDLGLAPIEGSAAMPAKDSKGKSPSKESGQETRELISGVGPGQAPSGGKRPSSSGSKKEPSKAPPAPAVPAADAPEMLTMEDLAEPAPAMMLGGSPNPGGQPQGKGGFKFPAAGAPRPKPATSTAHLKKNVWDTKLILVGSGTLLAIVLGSLGIIWALNMGSGDELLKEADELYRSSSYSQAVASYDKFIADYPSHASISKAKVLSAMAGLRDKVSRAKDWPPILELAKQSIEKIQDEKDFGEAGAELAALLPQIAKGLADQARTDHKEELIGLSEETLAMINKHVLQKHRPEELIKQITSSLDQTRFDLGRDSRLASAISEMRSLIEKKQTGQAYEIRRTLLRDYPTLAEDEKLKEVVLEISSAEKQASQYIAQAVAPLSGEPEGPAVGAMGVAVRAASSGNAAGVEGQTLFVLAPGAAYALDATTGNALWRRPVGFDTAFTPKAVNAGQDALLVDSRHNEVLLVNARTGDIRWRFPAGEPVEAGPIAKGSSVFVSTRGGKLFKLNAETGACDGHTQLPQPLNLSCGVDARERYAYQIAERSNLYAVNVQTGSCDAVLYLGHESSTVVVPPIVVSRYILLAENYLKEQSRLRVIEVNEDGSMSEVQVVPLDGHVVSPLQIDGAYLAVVTDRGALYCFRISAGGAGDPLTAAADPKPADSQDRAYYQVAMADGNLWTTGHELQRFELIAANSRLESKPMVEEDSGDTFWPLLTSTEGTLFHARQEPGKAGILVSALDRASGERKWEVQLGAAWLGQPQIDASGIIRGVSASGGLFEIPLDDLNGPARVTVAQIVAPQDWRAAAGHSITFADGTTVFASGSQLDRLLVYSPDGQEKLRTLFLADPLVCQPVGYKNGLLLPGVSGQVQYLDPRTGAEMAKPFQPTLAAGSKLAWRAPLTSSDGTMAISDGAGKLYRVELAENPQPHLVAAAEAALREGFASSVVVLDDFVLGAESSGTMLAYKLPGLEPGSQWTLGAPLAAGPYRVGDMAVAATTANELFCWSKAGELAWPSPLKLKAPLAGLPALSGQELVIALTNGSILRLAADGTVAGEVESGEALSSGPMIAGKNVVVSGVDGTLLLLGAP